jgi:hypothetical protein
MSLHRLKFAGAILERGFWLYAWRVISGKREFFYVGRTGDSSSRFAASPFSRLSQHLDVRSKANANMLLRHVWRLKLDPLACKFELFAFGPIFGEQATLELHRQYRDRAARLESAFAAYLRSTGKEVVGSHSSMGEPEPELFVKVKRALGSALGR